MASSVASDEQKRETGLSLEVIGGLFLFFDFLVLFFLPAGLKLGYRLGFAVAMSALAGVGIGFIAAGYLMRVRCGRA